MKNIVLIGFMGTGKTSTGRLLASRLGRTFIDIDKKVEEQVGMTITEIFARYGEEFFRRTEHNLIAEAAAAENAVIATGGGVVLSQDNMSLLRANGVIISLSASIGTIIERTGRRDTRPLLNRPDREQVIEKLLTERAGLYQDADLCLSTDECSPQQTVDKIIRFLRQGGL